MNIQNLENMSRGMFFTGSTADGRDIRPAMGVFINPNNPDEWSTAPYNAEQRNYVKRYNFHWYLMKKCNYDVEQVYKKIKNGTLRFFTKAEKEYIVKFVEDSDDE